MELLGYTGQVEAHFSPFGDSVDLAQDRCTVCAKYTIGSEISLNALNGTLVDVGEVEARFSPFRGSVNHDAR